MGRHRLELRHIDFDEQDALRIQECLADESSVNSPRRPSSRSRPQGAALPQTITARTLARAICAPLITHGDWHPSTT
jgi:hypothetical protein